MVDSGEKWGMKMFIGEYHHTIDEKGRIIIPAKFRDGLGKYFIVTRGIENCLFVYSIDSWNKICDKLNSLPFTKKDARQFVRFFMSGATEVELDKQGRINIASPLIKYSELKKECVIIGVGERIEIWGVEKWEDFTKENEESFSEIADKLFAQNIC